ncbi:MAG: TIGR02266 family protein [Deltaproteobacteria bacterium]|nr:TIGR02266 family protein [Deltaproteobacteria bacterium]
MKNGDNRRSHPRKPIELKVEYKRLNTFFADYTRNISKGGTFIKTRNPLDIGTAFIFHLHVPTLQQPLELSGRVKWIIADGEEKAGEEPGMGIEFVYDDDEARAHVSQMVEDLLREALGPHVATQFQSTRGGKPQE